NYDGKRRLREELQSGASRLSKIDVSLTLSTLNRLRYWGHANLLLRCIRRSIVRKLLANAPAVGDKSIEDWCVRRKSQNHIQYIVAKRASIKIGYLKCGGRSKLVRQCIGTKPCRDHFPVFARVRRRTGIGRYLLRKIRDRFPEPF